MLSERMICIIINHKDILHLREKQSRLNYLALATLYENKIVNVKIMKWQTQKKCECFFNVLQWEEK